MELQRHRINSGVLKSKRRRQSKIRKFIGPAARVKDVSDSPTSYLARNHDNKRVEFKKLKRHESPAGKILVKSDVEKHNIILAALAPIISNMEQSSSEVFFKQLAMVDVACKVLMGAFDRMPQTLESSKPNSPDIRDDMSAADDSESDLANLEREIYTPYKHNKTASNEKAEDTIRVSCPQLKGQRCEEATNDLSCDLNGGLNGALNGEPRDGFNGDLNGDHPRWESPTSYLLWQIAERRRYAAMGLWWVPNRSTRCASSLHYRAGLPLLRSGGLLCFVINSLNIIYVFIFIPKVKLVYIEF
ncbi:unnamed protein product [Phytophthora fragariaefolia]|uniref:Unnamed protein product n=1 Tax=Phytophthora fragariaefolia TaxID=1490495 RepID=A0A9W7CQP9_9STRA|nr:unnamed protein product [Phytophthora fragariaefolia]